jgi:hypothetical protein
LPRVIAKIAKTNAAINRAMDTIISTGLKSGRNAPEIAQIERSEYFESNKTAWGEVLQNLKRVVESPRS